MRIGLVLPTASGYSETFFANLIKGLEHHGHTIILFINSGVPESLPISNRIKTAPNLSGSFVKVALMSFFILIKSLVFHFKVSNRLFLLNKGTGTSSLQSIKNIIINSHIISEHLDWLHFGYGTMALGREQIAKAIGAKMAVSFRGFDIAIYPVKYPGCYKQLWENVDKIHVISEDISDLVYKNGFQNQAPLVKITPAIDTLSFTKHSALLTLESTHFVTIARLHWKKGLVYTLEALALLKEKKIPFHYTIIGEGETLEELKFTAEQLGINNQITFAGRIPHHEVKDFLAKSQIYLQYSVQEGFCNSVLEAQAMGSLCVVSDAEGLSENVLDGITGWVVPKRSPKLFAEKLIEVVNLPPSRKNEIALRARKRVEEKFDLKTQNLAFDLFYT